MQTREQFNRPFNRNIDCFAVCSMFNALVCSTVRLCYHRVLCHLFRLMSRLDQLRVPGSRVCIVVVQTISVCMQTNDDDVIQEAQLPQRDSASATPVFLGSLTDRALH